MRVFLSGDYAFLYQMYGLSGSSGMLLLCKIVLQYYSTSTITSIGRHCCQLCEITSDSLKEPRAQRNAHSSLNGHYNDLRMTTDDL